jgi:hypothetical protein
MLLVDPVLESILGYPSLEVICGFLLLGMGSSCGSG